MPQEDYDSGLHATDEQVSNGFSPDGDAVNKWNRKYSVAIPGSDIYNDFAIIGKLVIDWSSDGSSTYARTLIGLRVGTTDTVYGMMFKLRETATILAYVGHGVLSVPDTDDADQTGTIKFEEVTTNMGSPNTDFQAKGLWYEMQARDASGVLKLRSRYAKNASAIGKTQPSMSSWIGPDSLSVSQDGDWLPGIGHKKFEIWQMSENNPPGDSSKMYSDLAQVRFLQTDLTF